MSLEPPADAPAPSWLASPPGESQAGTSEPPGTFVEVFSNALTPDQLQAIAQNPGLLTAGGEPTGRPGSATVVTSNTLTPEEMQAITQGRGFPRSLTADRITGWHALALCAVVFGAWTGIQLFGYVTTTADYNAFISARACGAAATASCRGEYALSLTGNKSSSACTLVGRGSSGSWSGTFVANACNGINLFTSRSRAEVWQGELVHVWAPSGEYWSTDSAVGRHINSVPALPLPLFLDGVWVLAFVLALISWIAGRFRKGSLTVSSSTR